MVQEKMRHELLRILEELLSYHKRLSELLDAEREALLHNKLKELNEVTRKKDTLLVEMKDKEDQRRNLFFNISNVLNISPKEVTLSFLEKVWAEPRLPAMRKELKNLAGQVRNKQQNNTLLLKQSQEFLDSYVNLLTSMPQTMYGPKGGMKDNAKPSQYLDRDI